MSIDNNNVPVQGVVPLSQMVGVDEEDNRLLQVMATGAQGYIRCFPWCKQIREVYFGDGYGGTVAVFLVRIEPSRPGIDEWLWVVFGDVPPAYLVTDLSRTPSQALEVYVGEVSKWVELAKQSQSSPHVIPVYLPATPETAADVENRLKILRDVVIPGFREAEAERA
jgi:hypothetical protein